MIAKSLLFTPATRPERFAKAAEVRADVLIIDLEDSVEAAAKSEARRTALEYLAQRDASHLACALPCAVRVNPPNTRVGFEDLHALLNSPAQPEYVILPKCESAAEIGLVAGLLREAGKPAQVIALIETARGVASLAQIAEAKTRPAAFIFGAADMAADLGAQLAWEPLLWVRSQIVHAAAVAGIPAIDGPYFELDNLEGLARETRASASLGFHAKVAIHPSHIAIINEVFTPTAEEVAKAREVLEVAGNGAGSVDRQMVDEALGRRAKTILKRAGITD